jgi:putative transcriptional regulator
MSKAGSRILTSARQALAYATGETDMSQYGVHVPEHLDVRAIRQKIKMSQREFARHFGVNKRTVQDWEQGRRHPSGLARALLVVIDREPEAVYRALGA